MCKKSLLFLLLMALMAPWAANAQNSIPFNEGFESMTSVDDLTAAGWTLSTDESGTFLAIETGASNVYEGSKSLNLDAWNASSSSSVQYLGLPLVAGDLNTLQISFAYKVTSGTINVGYLTDATDFSTFTSLAQYSASSSFVVKTTDLSEAPGDAARLVIKYTGGYRLYLDSFEVKTLPSCEAATSITASDITATSATIAWEGEGNNWNLDYNGTVVNNISAMTYNLTGLTDGTNYTVKVQNVCDDGTTTDWVSTTFRTLELCPEGMVCIGEGTATNGYLPTYFFYNYSLTEQIYTADEIGTAGAIESVDIYSVGTGTRTLEIYMVSTEKRAFEGGDWIPATASDLVFSGEVTFAANSWNTFEFDNPFIYNGTSNVALIVRDMTGSYVSGIQFFVFEAESQALYAYRDASEYDLAAPGVTGTVLSVKNRVRFAIGEPPACPKPTGLAVNYEGGTSATFTWTENGTATSWDLQYSTDAEFNEYVSAQVDGTPSYELTGLELATTYYVRVNAFCEAPSEYSTTISFTTDDCMLADMTIVNYAFADSYGDGWNGNYILVLDGTCTIVDALTIENGSSASGTLKVCGSYIQFVWYMSGSSTYPAETSWIFTDTDGNVLFEGAGNANMATGDVLYTIDNNPVKTPTNFDVTEIGPRSAKLSWTENGTATAWQIMIDEDEDNIIDVNSNPFVVTGLDPETEYFMQVRAVNGDETSIWTCIGVDFYTTEPCPAPTELNVTPYPYTANVEWEGWGESYDIEWAEMTEYQPSADALWLVYDDGEWTNNIGNSTVYTWQWGVMYPADSLEGLRYLNKVAFYESSYFTSGEVVTFSIYSGGDDAPGTLIGTEEVTCTASDAIREITLSAPITIDPEQNLWITITSTTLTYPMTMCAVDVANGRWVNNGGTWIDIGTALSSVASCSFMIRGLLDNITPGYVWNTEEGVASPYTITDLNAETDYVVRVKAICGDDGESTWATTTFTTPSACDAATDLTAEAEATSANLSWTGYQDSYNLRYWSPGHMNAFNEADFTQVGEDIMADSVLTTYNFDLSAFSGVGNIAIRHYNVTDMFRLNVDDIVVTNAQGEVVASEDFESGEINLNWINYDNDGDGYVWDIWHITQLDADSMPVGNGEYCATSASYNSAGALFPDNWLIIPNVELGGTLTFVARGQDPSWSDEIFGVFVSTNELYVPGTDPITLEGVTNPYELTGLDPETPYAFQVQGINAECDEIAWSEIAYFTTPEQTTVTQTVALASGKNWFSTYVEITLADLQNALVAALPGTTITIKSQSDGSTTYNGSRWRGQLNSFDVTKMYKIEVTADCEIVLEGMPLDPAEHPVTIVNGANWIWFPFSTSMTVAEAFAGFAVNGDQVSSQGNGSTTYNGSRWRGQLTNLVPGQGYNYKSAATEDRTFTFPGSASKAAPSSLTILQNPKKDVLSAVKKEPNTIDIILKK